MRILLLQTRSFTENASGVPRITFNLGRYFTENGAVVAYFSTKHNGHISVKYGKLYHPSDNSGINSQLISLRNALVDFVPDIVINQMPYESEISNVLTDISKVLQFKIIGCIHNSLFTFRISVRNTLVRKLPAEISGLIPINLCVKVILYYHRNKHRNQLIEILSRNHTTILYTPPNYEELRYFVDQKSLNNYDIRFMPNPVVGICNSVPSKEKLILYVGSINVQQKRSDLLLDFWELCHEKLPDWEFKVVGTGPYYSQLKADLEKRLLPRVELLGFQRPEVYYEKAAILVMPSAYEGLPNTIIEANSFGCPILAFSSYSALEWIVENGKNAILAEPFDVASLASLFIEYTRDEEIMEEMQIAALENARRFEITEIGRQWLNLFNSLKESES